MRGIAGGGEGGERAAASTGGASVCAAGERRLQARRARREPPMPTAETPDPRGAGDQPSLEGPQGTAPPSRARAAAHGLAPYLVGHDAGAGAAIRLLARLPDLSGGEQAAAVAAVRQAVIEDRATLRALMARLGVAPSRARLLAAVAGETLETLKLHLQARRRPHLRVLEALDLLEAGIEGKKALWRTLAAAAEVDGALGRIDDRRLVARADEQQAALQPLRALAARGAVAGG